MYCSNPTPPQTTSALSVVWPESGILGKHLEIGENLNVKLMRPTDISIKSYQLAGLGNSPILNDCSITNLIPSIGDIVGTVKDYFPTKIFGWDFGWMIIGNN